MGARHQVRERERAVLLRAFPAGARVARRADSGSAGAGRRGAVGIGACTAKVGEETACTAELIFAVEQEL